MEVVIFEKIAYDGEGWQLHVKELTTNTGTRSGPHYVLGPEDMTDGKIKTALLKQYS